MSQTYLLSETNSKMFLHVLKLKIKHRIINHNFPLNGSVHIKHVCPFTHFSNLW